MTEDAIQQNILEHIRTNRVSTVEICDIMEKSGALQGVDSPNDGNHCAGRVHFAWGFNESNWPIHEQIEDVNEGDVVVIEAIDCNGRACIGDIMMKYMLLYRQAEAVVVNGYVRDMHRIKKEGYPLWCKGANPVGCYNRELKEQPSKERLQPYIEKYENSIAVCDDTGVCIIPEEYQNEEFIEKLEFIELQEDIWYYCVDTLKLTTYEAICEKKYMKDKTLIPDNLRKKLEDFSE